MATNDQRRRVDGFRTVQMGVDSGRDPSDLEPNQLAWAINATMRGGNPQCRPGVKDIPFTFEEGDDFTADLFQGAHAYNPAMGDPYIVASVGGVIYKVGLDGVVLNISGDVGVNPQYRPKAYMEVAEDFLTIQDGQSTPIIWNNAVCRRANDNEVPVGTIMKYAIGRLWVVRPPGNSYVAGDLVYSSRGTAAYGRRDAVLKFTENEFLNEGGEFPAGEKITGMSVLANLDTSLGQGPLQVTTKNTIFSVNAPFDRATWKDLNNPLITTSLINYGAVGPLALVNVNNDIWYRSPDGIRSFIVARRDFGSWGNVSMSQEVSRILNYDTPGLLDHCSAVLFDNRLLMTASPQTIPDHGVIHRALVALDFDETSSLKRDGIPAYDGIWTGLRILQILKVSFGTYERCFAFTLNSDDQIRLYEITKADRFDNTDVRIPWVIEGRSCGFGEPEELKKLETGDMWVDNLVGQVDFRIQYRPDQYPGWIEWHSWSECANFDCDPTDCNEIKPAQPQYRPRMTLPQPADTCEGNIGRPFRIGYEFTQRMLITGFCRIKKSRMVAYPEPEPRSERCRGTETCKDLRMCETNPFDYQIE